jgi:hypothetical protein
MDLKKLPAPLVAALSLAAQGCIASGCLTVSDKTNWSEPTGETGIGPCLAPILDHTGHTGCLSPPPTETGTPGGFDHTGATSGSGSSGSGSSGSGASSTAIDTDAVLDRLPPDVRQRLARP